MADDATTSVFGRGTDNRLWENSCNLFTYLLVVGIDQHLYIEKVGATGFAPAGGSTTASPALTALPSAQGMPAALVGFARGVNNAAYYHRFLSSSPGWHSMGGGLISGLAASTQIVTTIPMTATFGLGTDSQVYRNDGTWASYPPTFSGWHRVTG